MAVGDISDPIQFLHDAINDGLEAFGIPIVEKVPVTPRIVSSKGGVVLLRMGDASLDGAIQITVEVWAGVPAAGLGAQRALGKARVYHRAGSGCDARDSL